MAPLDSLVGDGVAVVLATSAAAARDGADLVDVEYAELPAVVDMADALAEGAPVVHEEMGTNHCYTWPLATGDVDTAFAEAEVVVSQAGRARPRSRSASISAEIRSRSRAVLVFLS